ncbi:MAG: Endonuclease/exonuclease/phosphatase [Chlamydiales bacterium]|jgi:endonuclease/exonuclease/phosphatase family metal-dependent hydrolase|nr:Endonuclease/exonuclease/phosphatase [Chlamydiales bacterium]
MTTPITVTHTALAKIRILSFNIHKGFDWTSQKLTLEIMKEAITSSKADIVFLQEVIGENAEHVKKVKDWNSLPQYEILAGEIWPYYAYAKNAVYEAGHHGNVILSKFPITYWAQEDISTNRFEQRGILYCNIEIPRGYEKLSRNHIIHAYCLHLDLLHRGRKQQYQAIMKRLKMDVNDPEITIVAGDFNDWNQRSGDIFEDQLGMLEVSKILTGEYAKTFPIYKPLFTLDRIYVKHIGVDLVQTLKDGIWRSLSDHAALYTELSINYE